MSKDALAVQEIEACYVAIQTRPVVPAGYKSTDVGVIPEEWEISSIGELFKLTNGMAFKPEDWVAIGVPIIRIQNLNDPTAAFNYTQRSFPERNKIEPGDLLFAWSGTVGTSFGARIWRGPVGVLNQHIFKVSMDERRIHKSFALTLFARVEEDIAKQAHGFKASFLHVKKSDLVKVKLPLPSRSEQKTIAEALSDVDVLLQELDRLIAKKRDIKQATMQQLLTGQTRLPGFEGEWNTSKLRNVVTMSRQHIVPAACPDMEFTHFSLPSFDAGECAAVELGSAIGSSKFRIPDNAVLLSKLNPRIPRVWAPPHIPANAVASTEWLVLIPDAGIEREYLYLLCASSSFAEAMQLGATGTTGSHQRISPNAAMEIQVLCPPTRSEQLAIAAICSDIESGIRLLEQRRCKVVAIKQAMMQELLTGRIRLLSKTDVVLGEEEVA